MIDLGPVRYEPPLTRSAAFPPGKRCVALPTGPRWLRGPSRWHRVRSATIPWTRRSISFHTWCGQLMYEERRPARSDEVPTDGLPLCGTCEGRAAGAGHTSPLAEVPLLFSPRRLTPPRWCPGGALKGELSEVSVRRELSRSALQCAVCDEVVPYKRMAWTEWRAMPAQHPPGPHLVNGCPQHAWQQLSWQNGQVYCRCGRALPRG